MKKGLGQYIILSGVLSLLLLFSSRLHEDKEIPKKQQRIPSSLSSTRFESKVTESEIIVTDTNTGNRIRIPIGKDHIEKLRAFSPKNILQKIKAKRPQSRQDNGTKERFVTLKNSVKEFLPQGLAFYLGIGAKSYFDATFSNGHNTLVMEEYIDSLSSGIGYFSFYTFVLANNITQKSLNHKIRLSFLPRFLGMAAGSIVSTLVTDAYYLFQDENFIQCAQTFEVAPCETIFNELAVTGKMGQIFSGVISLIGAAILTSASAGLLTAAMVPAGEKIKTSATKKLGPKLAAMVKNKVPLNLKLTGLHLLKRSGGMALGLSMNVLGVVAFMTFEELIAPFFSQKITGSLKNILLQSKTSNVNHYLKNLAQTDWNSQTCLKGVKSRNNLGVRIHPSCQNDAQEIFEKYYKTRRDGLQFLTSHIYLEYYTWLKSLSHFLEMQNITSDFYSHFVTLAYYKKKQRLKNNPLQDPNYLYGIGSFLTKSFPVILSRTNSFKFTGYEGLKLKTKDYISLETLNTQLLKEFKKLIGKTLFHEPESLLGKISSSYRFSDPRRHNIFKLYNYFDDLKDKEKVARGMFYFHELTTTYGMDEYFPLFTHWKEFLGWPRPLLKGEAYMEEWNNIYRSVYPNIYKTIENPSFFGRFTHQFTNVKNLKTTSIIEYLVASSLCGPSIERVDDFYVRPKGYKVEFHPPRLVAEDGLGVCDHITSKKRSRPINRFPAYIPKGPDLLAYKGETLKSRPHTYYQLPNGDVWGHLYPEILNYVIDHINPKFIDNSITDFDDWWIDELRVHNERVWAQYEQSYHDFVSVPFFQLLMNEKKDSFDLPRGVFNFIKDEISFYLTSITKIVAGNKGLNIEGQTFSDWKIRITNFFNQDIKPLYKTFKNSKNYKNLGPPLEMIIAKIEKIKQSIEKFKRELHLLKENFPSLLLTKLLTYTSGAFSDLENQLKMTTLGQHFDLKQVKRNVTPSSISKRFIQQR